MEDWWCWSRKQCSRHDQVDLFLLIDKDDPLIYRVTRLLILYPEIRKGRGPKSVAEITIKIRPQRVMIGTG